MRHLFTILFLAACAVSSGQTRYELHKYDMPESLRESDMPESQDVEDAASRLMFSYPSLAKMVSENEHGHKAVISATMSSRVFSGDYLHYDGRHTTDADIMAGGEMPVKGVGLLYGHGLYSRSVQRGVYQNYAVRSTDYLPYLVSDSSGFSRNNNERYLLEGGLSMSHGDWYYGVKGLYEGIATAKDDQPRRAVYSYWFRLCLSAAKVMPRWIIAVKAYPEINKQSVSVSSSKLTYRYLLFYGFGRWDRKESPAGYGYGRDSKILGAGGELLFKLRDQPGGGGLKALLTLGYNYRWMQTEESSFKNLYSSKTHHLTHRLLVASPLGSTVALHAMLSGEADIRRGAENVYENRKMDPEQSLYDYVLVGRNDLYRCHSLSETLRLKAVWNAAPQHSLSLSAAARFDNYKEKYALPDIRIGNTSLAPSLGIGYKMSKPKDHIDFDLSASYRMRLGSTFDYASASRFVFETAQAYIPYLLRGENRWAVQSSLVYSHDLRRGSVGMSASAGYSRRTDAPYVDGWTSPFGLRRSDKSLSISLFYMF